MKKIFILLILCLIVLVSIRESTAAMNDDLETMDNQVTIYYSGIELPAEKILLVRKNYHYGALKFIRFWTEKDGKEKYATYKGYYQGDGTGDFSNKNVSMSEGKASALPLWGPFRPFIYQPGNSYVKFASFRLTWAYKSFVGFMPPNKGMGDFGFEFAPTPWTDISQVNVFDPRIKWYRYDKKRKDVIIPIDQLWKDNINK